MKRLFTILLVVMLFTVVFGSLSYAIEEEYCIPIIVTDPNDAIFIRDQLAIYYNYTENCQKDVNGQCIESKKNFIIRKIRHDMKENSRSVYVPNQINITYNAANAYINSIDIGPE